MSGHTHVTRDIKPRGTCPGCDEYHDRHAPAGQDTGHRQTAAEEPPWGDDVEFGETCRRDAKLRDLLADVIADWMAQPYKPEDWQRNNADDLAADMLPYVHDCDLVHNHDDDSECRDLTATEHAVAGLLELNPGGRDRPRLTVAEMRRVRAVATYIDNQEGKRNAS